MQLADTRCNSGSTAWTGDNGSEYKDRLESIFEEHTILFISSSLNYSQFLRQVHRAQKLSLIHTTSLNTVFRMVKTLQFQDIQVPSPGFGAMGLSHGLGSDMSLEEAEPVLLKAIELGCTFWDTAVVYQAGVNEKLLGDFIRKHNVRDKVFSQFTATAKTRF